MLKRKIGFIIGAFLLMGGCTEGSLQQREETKQTSKTAESQPTEQTGVNKETKESSANVRENGRELAEGKDLSGTVVYVVDGDTLDVKLLNGKKERIRMTLIDTPETKHPRLGVQPFGPEASVFTKKLLTNKKVILELDVQERDRYGRVLAYVWLNGKLVNEELIAKGLARVAVFPPNTKYVDRFEKVQQRAREQQLGIWSLENYVTDRGYNTKSEKKSSPTDDCNIKGNISSSGEKIYHIPGGRSYEATKPEQIFCTKAEAEAAGFRAAKR